jgi:hypothetical protein
MTLTEQYASLLWQDNEIAEHLPLLFTLAIQSREIVEFGVREARSTTAFLAGQSQSPRMTSLYSYDIKDFTHRIKAKWTDDQTEWVFFQADTAKLEEIPDCDLLFIDSLHTYDQVVAEIRHAHRVRRWIVLHDTVLFGINGEKGEGGILPAINQFLERNPSWKLAKHYRHSSGLMVLQRT